MGEHFLLCSLTFQRSSRIRHTRLVHDQPHLSKLWQHFRPILPSSSAFLKFLTMASSSPSHLPILSIGFISISTAVTVHFLRSVHLMKTEQSLNVLDRRKDKMDSLKLSLSEEEGSGNRSHSSAVGGASSEVIGESDVKIDRKDCPVSWVNRCDNPSMSIGSKVFWRNCSRGSSGEFIRADARAEEKDWIVDSSIVVESVSPPEKKEWILLRSSI